MSGVNLKLCIKDLSCSCAEKYVQTFQCDCVLVVGMCKNYWNWDITSLFSHQCRPLCEVSRQSLWKQRFHLSPPPSCSKGCDLSGFWGKLWPAPLSPVFTALILGVFVKHWETPIVKFNNKLSATSSSSPSPCSSSAPYSSLVPNTATCILWQSTFRVCLL